MFSMRLPCKLYSYEESVFSKFAITLKVLQNEPQTPAGLYMNIKKHLSGINEYLELLDCLYAMGVIAFDEKDGLLEYAHRD